jgi:pimeloyl-ACP methyl ester carboxylesterase
MKKIIFVLFAGINISLSAQVISFEKLATFSLSSLDSIIMDAGLPQGVIVPIYEVDYYKVVYLSPYLHPDSLVRASGALVIPRVPNCALPLAAYGHGTQSKKSKVASFLDGGQWDINTIIAATGYVIAMPDYLGLGDSDPRIPMPPYSHNDSEANAMINMLRAARTISDSLSVALNGEIFLYGYSQGGAATAATVKEIELNYSSEFTITGSAPMSGAYDFKDAQVDLISSTNVFPTPAYFPYIILAYQSIYGNLFSNPSEFLVPPYDTLLPPLFYAGNTGINALNNLCSPVPRDMMIDSVMNAFLTDSLHPMRLNLLDNDLVRGWYPRSPMKILYCQGDDQVTYLNAENAYDAWTAAGSTQLEKIDLGGFTHNVCAPFAFLEAKRYFDALSNRCATPIRDLAILENASVNPNPFSDYIRIELASKEVGTFLLYNQLGQEILKANYTSAQDLNTSDILPGIYFYELRTNSGAISKGKLVK